MSTTGLIEGLLARVQELEAEVRTLRGRVQLLEGRQAVQPMPQRPVPGGYASVPCQRLDDPHGYLAQIAAVLNPTRSPTP